jgi:hypothetical protein
LRPPCIGPQVRASGLDGRRWDWRSPARRASTL